MSAVNRQPKKSSFTMILGGIIGAGSLLLFVYLMWYVAPEENTEMVKIIAITEQGCIAETMDGFSVNIGECQAEPGQYVDAVVDQKVKERAAAMNPTS